MDRPQGGPFDRVRETEALRRRRAAPAIIVAHAQAAVAAGAKPAVAHVRLRGFQGFLVENEAPYLVIADGTLRVRWLVGRFAWVETTGAKEPAHGWVEHKDLRYLFAPAVVAGGRTTARVEQ